MDQEKLFLYLNEFYPVSRETYAKLNIYMDELVKWQKKTNLIAPSTLDEIWQRHFADSLQVLQLVKSQVSNIKQWADLGSGGGFPGMVCAIILSDEARVAGDESDLPCVHFMESIHKKCAFLRHVALKTGANVKIHADRIENTAEKLSASHEFDVITARALSALPNLLDLSFPLFKTNTKAFYHKGREYLCEIEQSHNNWRYDLVEYQSRVAQDSIILEISNLTQK